MTKRFVVGGGRNKQKKTVTAADDVSIRIERGETYGVLGANGGGKSTLIRLVSTLLTIDAGKVEVFGHDIERDEMAVKRLINRVSVDAAFFKKLSPYENLIYAARLRRPPGRLRQARIGGHPGAAWHRRVTPVAALEQMSRGMQQKVAIARPC
ncbi:MAG: ATP-binding cassette domain-containing protein [Chloroflexota bacterium]